MNDISISDKSPVCCVLEVTPTFSEKWYSPNYGTPNKLTFLLFKQYVISPERLLPTYAIFFKLIDLSVAVNSFDIELSLVVYR